MRLSPTKKFAVLDKSDAGGVDQKLLERARSLAAAATMMAENLKAIGPITLPDLSHLVNPEQMQAVTTDAYENYKRENWNEQGKSSSSVVPISSSSKKPSLAHSKFSQLNTILPPVLLHKHEHAPIERHDVIGSNSGDDGYSSRKISNAIEAENYNTMVAERATKRRREEAAKLKENEDRILREKTKKKEDMEAKAVELRQKTELRLAEYENKKKTIVRPTNTPKVELKTKRYLSAT